MVRTGFCNASFSVYICLNSFLPLWSQSSSQLFHLVMGTIVWKSFSLCFHYALGWLEVPSAHCWVSVGDEKLLPMPAACGATKESVPSSCLLFAGAPLTERLHVVVWWPGAVLLPGTPPHPCSRCASDRRWQQHSALLSDDIFLKLGSPVLMLLSWNTW